jgi:hypothetical protein
MKNIFNKIFLLISFFSLAGLNLYCILKYFHRVEKYYQQEKILSEINGVKNNLSKQFSFSAAPLVLGEFESQIKLVDGRAANLRNFFRKYNSPLYDFAEFIVYVSDKYGFDYRLLPAIAMQESNLCKFIPENSFNCWGYGIYGNQVIRFSSYKEAIETVAQDLKKNYIDKGLTTPEAVMSRYTPSSPGSWARAVSYFIKALE